MSQIRRIFAKFDRNVAASLRGAERRGERLACRGRGCHWCCYDVSLISRWEVREMLSAFRRLSPEVQGRVRAQYERWMENHQDLLLGLSWDLDIQIDARLVERSAERDTPCMFLVDRACSVYDARPIPCRGHHSLDESQDLCGERNLGRAAVKCLDLSKLVLAAWARIGDALPPMGELHEMVAAYGGREGFGPAGGEPCAGS